MNNRALQKYIQSVIGIIEYLSKAEITKQGYQLICNYLDEAGESSYSGCARYTINKYLTKDIPTLDEIRQRHRSSGITEFDHLILKMEYEAGQLDKQNQL